MVLFVFFSFRYLYKNQIASVESKAFHTLPKLEQLWVSIPVCSNYARIINILIHNFNMEFQ